MNSLLSAVALSNARKKELIKLPSEHQSYFTSADRFTVHNANNIGSFGKKVFDDHVFPTEQSVPLSINMMNLEVIMDREIRARLIMIGLSEFYNDAYDNQVCPDYSVLFSSFMTMLGTYMRADAIVGTGLAADLEVSHRRLDISIYHNKEELVEATETVVEYFMTLFGAKERSDLYEWVVVVAVTIFVTIGKNITGANREGWYQNRWRAFGPTCGIKFPRLAIPPPKLGASTGLYTFMTSNPQIRKTVFLMYRSLASQTSNIFSSYFDKIINLLQWAEMSQMWLITHHVFDQNKEILCLPELSGPEISAMSAAILYMKSFPVDKRPFLKLTQLHADTKPIHSRNFPFFTAAARCIAAMNSPSMKNLEIDRNSNIQYTLYTIMNSLLSAVALSNARKKELIKLPSEHQSYFTSADRFTVHNANNIGSFGKKVFDDHVFPTEQSVPLSINMMN